MVRLTVTLGRDGSGKSSTRRPLSRRYSVIPSTEVTFVGAAARAGAGGARAARAIAPAARVTTGKIRDPVCIRRLDERTCRLGGREVDGNEEVLRPGPPGEAVVSPRLVRDAKGCPAVTKGRSGASGAPVLRRGGL